MIRDIMFSEMILNEIILNNNKIEKEIVNSIATKNAKSSFLTRARITSRIQQMIDEGILIRDKSTVVVVVINPDFEKEIIKILEHYKILIKKMEVYNERQKTE